MTSGRQLEAASLIRQREALVRSLSPEVTDVRVLDAMRKVPREQFLAAEAWPEAYQDRPLPIGHGQTISQPRMVAIMLQEMALRGDEIVLEVGTGSGYQTALLALLARKVFSVEIVPALAQPAAKLLSAQSYSNIEIHLAGDELGWPEGGPYDAIVVSAAAPRVPQALTEQLAPGGRLLIPVGSRQRQDLLLVQALPQGLTVTRKGACRFVPLIGREAYARETAGD